ncbi:hypothetical protein FK220_016050 [Flavobacteriaceae bacterium TP-CH-4]|uniref:Uncharacterized protein n=1 Tax=Pelagihabitans pacificus TaxID=2696054 RepID=A0A967B0H3_9FLAO|nr:hypothetical protein [Pelagihabitans pacificus]NHF60867.1 hypothetical protein [Pelagihabitans pacificus]
MRFVVPKVVALCSSFLIYCGYNTEKRTTSVEEAVATYKITMKRGGLHQDAFQVVGNNLRYIPDSTSSKIFERYNIPSLKKMDNQVVLEFFKNIEQLGFWKLNDEYRTDASCTSSLIVTVEQNGRIKTVRCDDFERNCPPVIKYIDQKVVELEGNYLIWTFLPG